MSQIDLYSTIVDTGNKLYIKNSNGAFTIACDETIFDAARGAIERKYPERSIWNSSPTAKCFAAPSTKRKYPMKDRKSTRLNSSHVAISYAVFCLKKKTSMCNKMQVNMTET